MKKAIIILALIAMVVLPVAAKKSIGAVGLELGQPTGVTFNYDLDDNWDGYATVAFGLGGTSYVDIVAGGQYKIAEFKIEKAKFDVNVGVQGGAKVFFGDVNGVAVAVRGTGSVSYDWTWKEVGDFTVYLRMGLGYAIALSENVAGGIDFAGALGLVYHL